MKKYLILLLFFSHLVYAQTNITPTFDNKKQEQQYKKFITILRCPTCQNQNIAESQAPLAQQLRTQLAEQIKLNQTDKQISNYFIQRYGDFISYEPPFALRTALLWLAPFGLMIVAMIFWLLNKKNRTNNQLTDKQKQELAELINFYQSK